MRKISYDSPPTSSVEGVTFLDTTCMHDLACVVHLHSLYSDGTGTVPEIVRAARRARADVVLLTDHDTLEAKHRGLDLDQALAAVRTAFVRLDGQGAS